MVTDEIDKMLVATKDMWDSAAEGWAKWEPTITTWMAPATEVMMKQAGIKEGAIVLDIATGAGTTAMVAAGIVGKYGRVDANDISVELLKSVKANATSAGYSNIKTLVGAAEEIDAGIDIYDAVISRNGFMLFPDPVTALNTTMKALKPGCRVSIMVHTVPENNPVLANPMKILMKAGKKQPPPPGKPTLWALGGPLDAPGSRFGTMLADCGFENVTIELVPLSLNMPSANHAKEMIKEAFGAFRAAVADQTDEVRDQAWNDVLEYLKTLEKNGVFAGPSQMVVVSGTKPQKSEASQTSSLNDCCAIF